jgi:glycosyltransferase involved in cell wall biosynthesis
MFFRKTEISVIEIDARDARYQSGIARYFDVLGEHMPRHIKTYKIIFYHSPEFKDIRITETDDELQIYHPGGYPSSVLFDAAIQMIGNKLNNMPNLIIKSNCLGYDSFLYMLKSRFYCKTVGVLHCLPHRSCKTPMFPPGNPFFNMDHVVIVCNLGREFLDGVKNTRPFSVIYNGIAKPKIKNKHPNDGVFRFIFANGWAPLKGFEKIIPAIRNVSKKA